MRYICPSTIDDITDIEWLFRDAEANSILSSAGLELSLDNFAVQALSNGLSNCSVIVRSETLCTLLTEAEEWHDKSTILESVKSARMKRKHRQKTPKEQLTMSDEEKFVEKERRIRMKTEKKDEFYSEEGL